MGRQYSVPFSGVAVTVAQDLWEITPAAGYSLLIHEIVVGQITDAGDAAAELLAVLIKRGITNTSGSGGTTPTPSRHRTADGASGATVEMNNTTQAVAGGGSLTTLRAEAMNVQTGYQYLPIPEGRIHIAAGESLIVSLTAPADSLTMYGCVTFEEILN